MWSYSDFVKGYLCAVFLSFHTIRSAKNKKGCAVEIFPQHTLSDILDGYIKMGSFAECIERPVMAKKKTAQILSDLGCFLVEISGIEPLTS